MTDKGFGKAREVPQTDLARRVQDVAISTRIAINHAAKALEYAEVALKESEAAAPAKRASKEAKRRAKDIEKAEAKLQTAIEAMKKVRGDLDSALRSR